MKKIRLILALCFSVSCLFVYAQTPFGQGNLLVLRAGNGAATANSVPVAIVEYNKSGQEVQTINIPSTGTSRLVSASNNSAIIEGFLNLSDDNEYVTFAGYNAAPDVANLQNSSSTTYPRVVGRFDASGDFSTVTASSITGGTNTGVRSAIQLNKNQSWTIGQGNFLWYLTLRRYY